MTENSTHLRPKRAGSGRPRSGDPTVRLAYRGRDGARFTYSPTVIRTQPDAIEVIMLVPLRVGLPVEIEPTLQGTGVGPAHEPARTPRHFSQTIQAEVAGCRCNAEGLFRIRLTFRPI
jgi:hypothetical protein